MQTFYQNQARIGTGKMKAEGGRVRVKIDLQCRVADLAVTGQHLAEGQCADL